ncbi:MAG TPA: hypothetical protein VFI27_14905 [candidate division Zixibacteria bacterium]|nr:hypothetical protein [candidate division Zixibacteria bacterium]
MGDRKHGEKSNETKAVQPKREEEQQPGKNPAEALSRLTANMAQPSDILTLQRTVGNRAVRRLITKQSHSGILQRHVPSGTLAAYEKDFPALKKAFKETGEQIKTSKEENLKKANAMVPHLNAVVTASVAAVDYPAEGGGGSQSQQEGGDFNEGGGESQSPQGGEDIYEGGEG